MVFVIHALTYEWIQSVRCINVEMLHAICRRSYILCLGLLLPAYSYTGIDGPAHMSEETNDASTGPAKV